MSESEQFSRTRLLIGDKALEKLKNSRVAVFGVGGVGGFVTCASDASTSDNPAATLLTSITSLLDLVKNLGTSIADTISALTDL